MNKLQELNHLKALPFEDYEDFKFEKDIEEACKYAFLTHLKYGDEDFVEKWTTRDEFTHRYILVKVSEKAIQDYWSGSITMLELLKSYSEKGFIVDHVFDPNSETSTHIQYPFKTFDEVPDAYLPKEGIYHDPELRPGFCEEDT